jgi:hypothetical protein
MNIVTSNTSLQLKNAILDLYKKYEYHFQETKTINGINLYTKYNKTNVWLIDILKNENETLADHFTRHELVYIQFINSYPDNDDQFYHIDYNGDSISYFIPLVDINELNGTKYLSFVDKENYKKHYNLLLNVSYLILSDEDVIIKLEEHDLHYGVDYTFETVSSKAFGIIELPNYCLHRGQKNKTNVIRTMVCITFSLHNSFHYPETKYSTVFVNDLENDEGDGKNAVLQMSKNKYK